MWIIEKIVVPELSGKRLVNLIISLSLSLSVTRLGDLLDFGQVFKTFGNN